MFVAFSIFDLGIHEIIIENGKVTLTMPEGFVAKKEVTCWTMFPTGELLGGKEVGYITRFDPLPQNPFVHHMRLMICPDQECDEPDILYGWGHGAASTVLPDEVSVTLDAKKSKYLNFEVGLINYIKLYDCM